MAPALEAGGSDEGSCAPRSWAEAWPREQRPLWVLLSLPTTNAGVSRSLGFGANKYATKRSLLNSVFLFWEPQHENAGSGPGGWVVICCGPQ